MILRVSIGIFFLPSSSLYRPEVAPSRRPGNIAAGDDVPSTLLLEEEALMLAVERPVRAVLAGVLRGGGGGRSRDEGILLLGLEEGALLQGEGRCGAEGSKGGGAAVRPDDGT